jgi:membrane protein YdbS with pleckstrin-like domain
MRGGNRVARKERLTEDIKYRTEMLRLAWATLIAIGAGSVGVVLKEIDVRVAAGVGAVVLMVLGVTVGQLHRSIRVRIQDLEEV